MAPIQLILNVLWIVFGGLVMALLWVLAGVIMAFTIVGIPWARAAFIAFYTLLPFGHEAVPRHWVTGQEDIGSGPLGVLGNISWPAGDWRSATSPRRLCGRRRSWGFRSPGRTSSWPSWRSGRSARRSCRWRGEQCG